MKNNSFSKLFSVLIDLFTFGLVLVTFAGFLGKVWWIFDLASHFRVQYLIGFAFLLLANGIAGRKWAVFIVGIFFAVNAILVVLLWAGSTVVEDDDQKIYKIVYGNVLTENPDHRSMRDLIIQADPDFVALLEVNQEWLDDLDLANLGYEYSITEPRSDNFGIAFYSRYPLEESDIHWFGRWEIPSISATAYGEGIPITFVVTHPVPPKNETLTWHRNFHMSELAEYASALDGNIILAADLNASSWSPFFRDWIETSQLQDSRRGFGVQATWPTYNNLLRVPIDHILISNGVQVRHHEVGPHIGSDHFPLLMDFSILDKTGEN